MKLTATYQGKTVIRNSKRPYTHAAVVYLPWNGQIGVWSFHTSEELARKADLTAMQRKNGAVVVDVVPVIPA